MDSLVTAVYLRFAAPLQSWATSRVTGNIVRTERRPTRSAIVGLIAGALGALRDAWPAWLADLKIEVRTEYTGEYIDDFQTINPRDEDPFIGYGEWWKHLRGCGEEPTYGPWAALQSETPPRVRRRDPPGWNRDTQMGNTDVLRTSGDSSLEEGILCWVFYK